MKTIYNSDVHQVTWLKLRLRGLSNTRRYLSLSATIDKAALGDARATALKMILLVEMSARPAGV